MTRSDRRDSHRVVTGPSNYLHVAPADYLPRLRELCDRHSILLIVDEIMSGFGRTGECFAVDHWSVQPDIVTLAKGLTSGAVPLASVVRSEKVAAAVEEQTFWGGLTYSGHLLACAGAAAALEIYESEHLVENAARHGKYLAEALPALAARHASVGNVRGLGLFWAIELVRDRATRAPLIRAQGALRESAGMAEIRRALLHQGVYAFLRSNLLAITPPLCITRHELDEGLAALDKALEVADRLLGDTRAHASR